MTLCPFCGEKIKNEKQGCPGCGYRPTGQSSFSSADAPHCDTCDDSHKNRNNYNFGHNRNTQNNNYGKNTNTQSYNLGQKQNTFNANTGGFSEEYKVPVWFKIVIFIVMFAVTSGSIVGLVIGKVLGSSKDPKYVAYGQAIFKVALISIIVKIVFIVVWIVIFNIMAVTAPFESSIWTWI